jgi:predicted amidohydrolase YtcJ
VVEGGRVSGVVPEIDAGDVGADEVVDLAGGVVAPGFVDAHVHTVQGGLERIRCDLTEATTREDCLAAVAAYAAANPDLPWILGGGWAMSAFPGRVDLDRRSDRRAPSGVSRGVRIRECMGGDRGHLTRREAFSLQNPLRCG